MNKEKKVGFIFSIIMIVLTCIIYKIRLEETYSISMLINKLSYGMQIRQIAASYYLFIYFRLLVNAICRTTMGNV